MEFSLALPMEFIIALRKKNDYFTFSITPNKPSYN